MPEAAPETRGQAAEKPTQPGIPPTRAERDRVLSVVGRYASRRHLVPPLAVDELTARAARILESEQMDPRWDKFAAILLNNEVWRSCVAAIPPTRRLLLLSQCLRDPDTCPAKMDAYGLLCRRCGRCPLADLHAEAEKLGYVVMVAEGSTVVMSLIEAGKVEAIVGVSCMSVLEKVFPYMEAAAIPGIAIPLLRDGCRNTAVDLDRVREAIHLSSDASPHRVDLDVLRRRVDGCFEPDRLAETLGAPGGQTEGIALEWLAGPGKRWRPFLTVCACQAFRDSPLEELSADLRRVAVAVECFHKASLIHDDIEDGDELRYGTETLHRRHGVPVALNVGDFLLGEGYRLLAETGADAQTQAAMMHVAAAGQRELCVGQGAELDWARNPRVLTVSEVIDIFRRKTAPAFEVALRLGTIFAGCADGLRSVLHQYSEALGIAYQIRDDISDFDGARDGGDAEAMRPSLLLALAHEAAVGGDRELLESLWMRRRDVKVRTCRLRDVIESLGADAEALRLLQEHKTLAVRSLGRLANAELKGLLRRMVGKIFNDIEIMEWCREHEG